MSHKRQRRINVLVGSLAALAFLIVSSLTVVWANGLKFNPETNSFERTVVVAITPKLDAVEVRLNNQLVGDQTPFQLRNLTPGVYNLTIAKPDYVTFRQRFTLAAGEAGVVRDLSLIAEKPKLTPIPAASYLGRDRFDTGFSTNNAELLDYGHLVTRFSQPLIQAHRFNGLYLYQLGSEIHLFSPSNTQDYLVYQSSQTAFIPLNLDPAAWSLVVFDQPVPQQVGLTVPSAQ